MFLIPLFFHSLPLSASLYFKRSHLQLRIFEMCSFRGREGKRLLSGLAAACCSHLDTIDLLGFVHPKADETTASQVKIQPSQ